MPDFTLKKSERLCSKKAFELLFAQGKSFLVFPIKVVYIKSLTTSENTQVAFSVSKKKFKRAYQRNYIKRMMREAYRLNKAVFLQGNYTLAPLNVIFIYVGKDIVSYKKMEASIKTILSDLKKRIQDENS